MKRMDVEFHIGIKCRYMAGFTLPSVKILPNSCWRKAKAMTKRKFDNPSSRL
jgi:hypothetical protein